MKDDGLNGRQVHHWSGQDRTADIAALANAIAAAVKGLYNHNGAIARLDGNGGLSPVNLAGFRELITKHVCAARAVNRDGVWRQEYVSYAFDPPQRYNPQL